MGTNYYLEEDRCLHCDRAERLHIGKSSAGWVFALHVIPDEGINSLEDWEERWSRPNVRIVDEYNRDLTPAEMMLCITTRSGHGEGMNSKRLASNHDMAPGPNGLVRSRVDGRHCIAHAPGTWDLCVGEFS